MKGLQDAGLKPYKCEGSFFIIADTSNVKIFNLGKYSLKISR